jgi:uridine kinase
MRKPIMIGIAGGSGSGKTTIARKIQERCSGFTTLLFQLDHYYRDLAHLDPTERDKVNFDHPDALEMPLLESHVQKLAAGHAILRYDFGPKSPAERISFISKINNEYLKKVFA